MNISQKINNFFGTAIKYHGEEIALQSNQYFSIDQIVNDDKEQDGKYDYHIQYGFPQSGCISMKFTYSENENAFSINDISIYVPPANQELIIANYAPEMQFGEMQIQTNIGVDMKTQKYSNLSEIELNPNAIKMLDMAISDLQNALVIGENKQTVSIGSDIIPCCSTVPYPHTSKKK